MPAQTERLYRAIPWVAALACLGLVVTFLSVRHAEETYSQCMARLAFTDQTPADIRAHETECAGRDHRNAPVIGSRSPAAVP